MKISYIVVTFKSNHLIRDCLDSIIRYNDESYEIIVVDNSPDLENKELFYLLDSEYPFVIKIRNKNKGYGHGNNVGIKRCSGELIAIVNPDIRFLEPFVKKTRNYFNNNSYLALLGYKQIGGRNFSFYMRPEFFCPIIDNFLVRLLNRVNFFNPKIQFLSGACMFIRKTSFENIGLFDENIFLYHEEADITQRFLKSNFKIKFKSQSR